MRNTVMSALQSRAGCHREVGSPRHRRTVVKAQDQFHAHGHPTAKPDEMRTRSETDSRNGMKSTTRTAPLAVSKSVSRISDAVTIAPRYVELPRLRPISQRPVPRIPQQRRETRIGIESWPAKPIDGAIAPDQRSSPTIADERVVFDSGSHAWSETCAVS